MPTGSAYHDPMAPVSTIKLPTATRDRLRAQAQREQVTQSALVATMLEEREAAQFWVALAAAPPPTDAELDEVDAAFVATADDGGTP